jgi:hypothetical protein
LRDDFQDHRKPRCGDRMPLRNEAARRVDRQNRVVLRVVLQAAGPIYRL